jgi:multidrug efflux pump subunit AcrB
MNKLTARQRKMYGKICIAAALAISVLAFSPLVLAKGRINPKYFGMPYVLWMSMLISALLVVLTWLAGRFHLTGEEGGES